MNAGRNVLPSPLETEPVFSQQGPGASRVSVRTNSKLLYHVTDVLRLSAALIFLTMLRKSEVSPRPLTLSASVRLSTMLAASSPVCSDGAENRTRDRFTANVTNAGSVLR